MSETVQYQVKRQQRKTLALHVLPDASIEVRAPKWVSRRVIVQFVEQRVDWLLSQQQKVRQQYQQRPRFSDAQEHYYQGERYPLSVEYGARRSVQWQGGGWYIQLPEPTDSQRIEQALHEWFRGQAQRLFVERLAVLHQLMPAGTPMPILKIRKMRRRWGSCSSKQVMTLNLLLIQLPPACIDYVICHELCHLWQLNHSPAFYRLLSTVMPDWREREQRIDDLSQKM